MHCPQMNLLWPFGPADFSWYCIGHSMHCSQTANWYPNCEIVWFIAEFAHNLCLRQNLLRELRNVIWRGRFKGWNSAARASLAFLSRYTHPDSGTGYIPGGPFQVGICACHNWVYILSPVHIYRHTHTHKRESPVEIQTPTHRNLIGRKHYRPTACVVAQQYSSITFISLRFQNRKEKIGACFKNVIFLLFKNCATWNCLIWGASVLDRSLSLCL